MTVPAFTTMGGLYERATGSEPFNAAQAFIDNEARVNKDVVYDFASTNDIIGGNSGSPVVDRKGELVGIIFDGNIQSLVLDFGYTDEQARAVAVDSRGILGALRTVYRAEGLLRELLGRKDEG